MHRVRRVWMALAGLCCFSLDAVADEPKSLAAQVPDGAVVFAEMSDLEVVLDRVQKSQRVTDYLASDLYVRLSKQPDIQKAVAGQKLVESQVGMDFWALTRTLLGGRLAVAIYPHEGRKQPDSVLIIESPDADRFQQLRSKLDPFLQLAGDKIGRSEVVGAELLDLDGKGFGATGKDWLVLSSTRELAEGTLKRRAGQSGRSVADQSFYQQVQSQLGGDRTLRVAFDSAALAKGLNKPRLAPERADNALGSLLLQGLTELFATTQSAGIAVDLKETSAALTIASTQGPDKLAPRFNVFFGSLTGQPARVPELPGLIAAASISRQLAPWYNGRDTFLRDSLLPDFDKFESGLGNILPNRDFGSDVLPLFGPTMTFVVAPQDLSHLDGKPGVVLPGFALIADLQKPEEAEAIAQLFFQTIASVANLNAGQEGRQPWLLTSEVYKNSVLQTAKYLQTPKGDPLPVIFNFRPAAVRVGNRYVLSSSLDLAKRLVDTLNEPVDMKANARDLLIEVRGEPLADALSLNRDHLVAQGVREGRTAERSASDVEFLLLALRQIGSLSLSTQAENGGYSIRLEGQLK